MNRLGTFIFNMRNLYFLQSSGNRLYFKETLKVNLNAINRLKKMNVSLPDSTPDYDEKFVYELMLAVMNLEEMKAFSSQNNLQTIDRNKRRFIKSKNN